MMEMQATETKEKTHQISDVMTSPYCGEVRASIREVSSALALVYIRPCFFLRFYISTATKIHFQTQNEETSRSL